jgi:hypothetical protein
MMKQAMTRQILTPLSTALSRAQKQAYNPPNYWRSPIGHVEQTPARAVSNVGVRNI